MIDPETTRFAAHVLLDAVSVHGEIDADEDQLDEMRGLSVDRLAEIDAVRVTQDDETGKVTVDIRRLLTASLVVIHAALTGWAACRDVDRDQLITEMRAIVDESIVE